jgi:hypothetical protein
LKSKSTNLIEQPRLPGLDLPSDSSVAKPMTSNTEVEPETAKAAYCLTAELPNATEAPMLTSSRGELAKAASGRGLLTITSGTEPMQARAIELYSVYATLMHLSDLELRNSEPPVSLEGVSIDAVKAKYLSRDFTYEKVLGARLEHPELDIDTELFRAGDNFRKRIGRATRDLLIIGALTMNSNGYPSTLQRLPEICRILSESGVVYVRLCPGGKRALCDIDGNEVQPNLKDGAKTADNQLDLCAKSS